MGEFINTGLPGVLLHEPKVYDDKRGYFFEIYRKSWFADLGIDDDFVQQNQSASVKNTLRGLHYQLARPQAKLVRVTSGTVWDIAVDVRRGSPAFGRWFGCELSGENRRMMYVPKGFAHGFYVLSDQAEFHYLCSDYYDPASERGIAWNCPRLAVDWPIPAGVAPILSPKDQVLPTLELVDQEQLPSA